jgi:hypothetical protein
MEGFGGVILHRFCVDMDARPCMIEETRILVDA